MPFFKDLGSKADKLLGGRGGHESYIDTKDLTIKTKAANGTKFTFDKTIGETSAAASAKAEFKHSSGVNFKKISISTAGKCGLEAELAEAMPNTKMYVKIATLKDAVNSFGKFKDGDKLPEGKSVGDFNCKKANEENGALGFKFDNKDVAVDASVDILAMDAPVIKMSMAMGVPGVDGLTVGADAVYKTSLDNAGGATTAYGGKDGKKGMQMCGPTNPAEIVKAVAATYNGGDFDITAKFAPKSKALDFSYHHGISADTALAATVGIKADNKPIAPKIVFGGSYNVDKDTTVYAKIASDNAEVSLAFTQALSSSVSLTCATAVSAQDMSAGKFGMGLEFTN